MVNVRSADAALPAWSLIETRRVCSPAPRVRVPVTEEDNVGVGDVKKEVLATASMVT